MYQASCPCSLSSHSAVGGTSGTIRKSALSTVNSGFTLEERQKRLSEKFNSLIRAKIIELVKQRGYKKTICPSERMGEEAKVGDRLIHDYVRGTVRFVGEVPPTTGVWYGVDWDDKARGRHDGSHKGVRYFTTRFGSSGSFIRPGKASRGITLEEAVRGRYQDEPVVMDKVVEGLQKTINARFVEIVGMDKIGKKQSNLELLETVVLDGWPVRGAGESNLSMLLPRMHHLDVSASLLSTWEEVASITKQLPSLRFLNLSENMLQLPACKATSSELVRSLEHVEHLVLNRMMVYSWEDLLLCCQFFPRLRKLQVAFNDLEELGPIPEGQLNTLEDLDVGANLFTQWKTLCHLGSLPKLSQMNVNDCKLQSIAFPETPVGEKTKLFPKLSFLMVANNPLDVWTSVGELNKLPSLEELIITHEGEKDLFFQEFTFARIFNLKTLNRTYKSHKERKDCELFYLKTFGNEWYTSGGTDDLATAKPSQEFIHKHPTFLQLIKEHGAPVDESHHKSLVKQKLKDLKIELLVTAPDKPDVLPVTRSFLSITKVGKVKMMLRRLLKINARATVDVTYVPADSNKIYEIPLDNDIKELDFFSINNGDTLCVRWQ
ncbi:tubulin-binding cofactor E isoform X2 [Oratosquilla oratoria]|uniref:tubulin-binding cofactor E isoform X2 n=1 Tax=Oratosquilla oratoria TaxID=337810 RepID=UPI003F767474